MVLPEDNRRGEGQLPTLWTATIEGTFPFQPLATGSCLASGEPSP